MEDPRIFLHNLILRKWHIIMCWSTSKDIRNMSEDELLDMDYFLNEDDLFADEAGVEGFYIF